MFSKKNIKNNVIAQNLNYKIEKPKKRSLVGFQELFKVYLSKAAFFPESKNILIPLSVCTYDIYTLCRVGTQTTKKY